MNAQRMRYLRANELRANGAVVDDENRLPVELGDGGTGQDLRGLVGDRPAADSVDAGTTYWSVDRLGETDELSVSTGSAWVDVPIAAEPSGAQLVEVSGSNIAYAEEAPSSGAGNDSTDLTSVASGDYASAHAVMVNEAGTVTVTMVGGTDWEAPAALVAGVWHPFPPFTRVKATGTSATGVQVGY